MPSPIEELLGRAVMLHNCLPFDRHQPFVKSMRVLVKLRQENAPGCIELNVIDQHSDESA
jgi:hypothetical protein